jgi:HD-like signal output (HDOD) protein
MGRVPAQVKAVAAATRAMTDASNAVSTSAVQNVDNCEIVHDLLQRRLAGDELAVPLLPEVAVRIVRAGPQGPTNAQQLAEIINADPALTMYVLRVARSAAQQPALPIGTLQHAVAWLGFDEVANIAFTLALQGKMLDVKGQQHKARRLWRHSLASALWSRQLAHMLAEETGMCYLCGLLHDIGKVVALGAIHEVAQRAGKKLAGEEYDRLIDTFHRHVGASVIGAWALPSPVQAVASQWDADSAAGPVRFESNVVNVAHALADFTLLESTQLARDLLVLNAAYRNLGLTSADSESLFDSASAINAELDRYLAA